MKRVNDTFVITSKGTTVNSLPALRAILKTTQKGKLLEEVMTSPRVGRWLKEATIHGAPLTRLTYSLDKWRQYRAWQTQMATIVSGGHVRYTGNCVACGGNRARNWHFYSQIIAQEGVTGKSWCDFFVYNRH